MRAGRLVRGVKNGPSPAWLQRRLTAIGLRPINALVDITNYITADRGRPLHVFDAAKVKGDLVVRRARAGETLADGTKAYTLDDTMCIIADERGPESLAGIMGGEAGGCAETTTDVLIERGRRCGTRPTSRTPDAGSASTRMRAIASSAASILPSCCPGSSSATQMVDRPVRQHAVRRSRSRAR